MPRFAPLGLLARALLTLALVAPIALTGCGGPSDPAPDAGRDQGGVCASDAVCDDGVFCNGAERCDPGAANAAADGCAPPAAAACSATEICDETARTCTPNSCPTPDADGDGHASLACGGDDCDDDDANRFPGNPEVCDTLGHDEDCDALTVGPLDLDRDGFIDRVCCNGATCGEDCDDRRRNVNPGVPEVCDGFDNDCNGNVDEGVSVSGFWDEDLDNSGDAARPRTACAGSLGFALTGGDCNDANPHQSHLLPEVCDTVDNDCDGETDENPRPLPWYLDDDEDVYASPNDGDVIVACDPPSPKHVLIALDCDDNNPNIGPLAPEICDGLDNNCNGWPDFFVGPFDYEDDDRDGFADAACGGPDCNDNDPGIFPGAAEFTPWVDDDCDGRIDETSEPRVFYRDADGDGFGRDDMTMQATVAPSGYAARGGDCSDADADRYPNAMEVCDGDDEDCDGRVDEGATNVTLYADRDGDGRGAPGTGVAICVPGSDPPPDGWSADDVDCDDDDATRYPGATELCDGDDEDCDVNVDEDAPVPYYEDADGDGVGTDADGPAGMGCDAPANTAYVIGDCDDEDATRYPGATELCDGDDEDCDVNVDEEAPAPYYADADGDGVGTDAAGPAGVGCDAPANTAYVIGDCDDGDPTRYPGAPELCDGDDEDCDVNVDEEASVPYYADADGDGFGADAGGPTGMGCDAPANTAYVAGDCDDALDQVFPGAVERCGVVDWDCDGASDDGRALTASFRALGVAADGDSRFDVADLDQDGDQDIVASGVTGAMGYGLYWLENTLDGLTEHFIVTAPTMGAVGVGDLNEDGELDIALALDPTGSGPNRIRIYANDGSEGFSLLFTGGTGRLAGPALRRPGLPQRVPDLRAVSRRRSVGPDPGPQPRAERHRLFHGHPDDDLGMAPTSTGTAASTSSRSCRARARSGSGAYRMGSCTRSGACWTRPSPTPRCWSSTGTGMGCSTSSTRCNPGWP